MQSPRRTDRCNWLLTSLLCLMQHSKQPAAARQPGSGMQLQGRATQAQRPQTLLHGLRSISVWGKAWWQQLQQPVLRPAQRMGGAAAAAQQGVAWILG